MRVNHERRKNNLFTPQNMQFNFPIKPTISGGGANLYGPLKSGEIILFNLQTDENCNLNLFFLFRRKNRQKL